jgi:hypothetical protein
MTNTMEVIAIDKTVFSLTLTALFLFGILYALLVNWMSQKKVRGQTAYMVVAGVSIGLIASIPTLGLTVVSILFSYFAACGLPMVVEYGIRVHIERQRDEDAAQSLAKEAITQAIIEAGDHDRQTSDREK